MLFYIRFGGRDHRAMFLQKWRQQCSYSQWWELSEYSTEVLLVLNGRYGPQWTVAPTRRCYILQSRRNHFYSCREVWELIFRRSMSLQFKYVLHVITWINLNTISFFRIPSFIFNTWSLSYNNSVFLRFCETLNIWNIILNTTSTIKWNIYSSFGYGYKMFV